MGLLSESTLVKYVRTIKNSPRELFFNRRLLVSAVLYACAGIPITWDQGSSSIIPSLHGFQRDFGITSGANASQISNFISFVYLTAGIGAGLSFFINDRIGRLWSLRLYMTIWIIGQLVATFSSGKLAVLYTARFISGLGIGPLTVTGPMSIVEIAPYEIRGLLTTWFSVAMLLSLTVSCFVVYASFLHIAVGRLQYQVVWFLPCIIIAAIIGLSFFAMSESPRWLMLVGRQDEALDTLVALRGLPASHPYVAREFSEIRNQIESEHAKYGDAAGGGIKTVLRETFLVPANLRRVQQACMSYILAQLSGANSVTSYLVPILALIGVGGSTDRSMFLTGMYSMAKFFYTLIASFFFIDALGRRKSLFIGITIQMISDIYIGVFLKYKQAGSVAAGASEGAIAAIYIHGFGYAVGLLVLPYVFGAELWPNNIRSFGSALSQCFHWLFYFGVNKGTPSLLKSMHNWGTFLFFAGWCFIALLYVYVAVPETSGLSIEATDKLFEGPFWQMSRQAKKQRQIGMVLESSPGTESVEEVDKALPKGHEENVAKIVNYLKSLEARVAYLEGLLQESRPDVASDHLEGFDGASGYQNQIFGSNRQPHMQTGTIDFLAFGNSSPLGDVDEGNGDDLSSEVALLCLSAAGREPHYFGPSCAVSFSRIVSTAMGLSKRQGSSQHSVAGPERADPEVHRTVSAGFPSASLAATLSQAYFKNIHSQYPFLHKPTFRTWEEKCFAAHASGDLNSAGDIALFFVLMVYAIGSLALGPTHCDSAEAYYAMALDHQESVLDLDGLESIQSILCCAVYSIRSPVGVSLWKVSGMAIRHCIELGYHRSVTKFRPNVDPLAAEMSRRCFWVAYDIDRVAAFILGRPMGIPDDSIDVEMPMDLQDDHITKEGLAKQPRSADEPSTTMTGAIHVIKLRRLWSKFANTLYPTTTQRTPSQSTTWQVLAGDLRQELEEWYSAVPEPVDHSSSSTLSVFASKAWFQLAYDHSILLLYRHYITLPPPPGEEESVARAFEECAHRSQRFKQATTYRDTFEALSEKTIKMICNDTSGSPDTSRNVHNDPTSIGNFQSAVSQDWILGLTDMAMPLESEWFVQELVQGMREVQQPDFVFGNSEQFGG
ncbi:hypothetical protein OPT61_g1659 [Boeremia exigua]|uniref:Uncharacterized protein n=1 Tax=Boeremia exigua TaxID=749465 RepID=A0ACC2IPI7_9PLEO|nr:hypothetical protein OPT61_g1659 [Boeremia exigua]